MNDIIRISFFRGFTKFSRADYLAYKAGNKILPDGVNAKVSYIAFCQMLAFQLYKLFERLEFFPFVSTRIDFGLAMITRRYIYFSFFNVNLDSLKKHLSSIDIPCMRAIKVIWLGHELWDHVPRSMGQ